MNDRAALGRLRELGQRADFLASEAEADKDIAEERWGLIGRIRDLRKRGK